MTAPRYYCPPGVARPAHIRALAPGALSPGAGPDGAGGLMFGGPYDPEERDQYHQAADGWWVRLTGVTPRDLLRTTAVPGFDLDGWVVPHILTGDISEIGYWSDVGYVVPPTVAPLVDALRTELDHTGPVLPRHAKLAGDLLAFNYHVSLFELGRLEVLTNARVWRTLQLASGVTHG